MEEVCLGLGASSAQYTLEITMLTSCIAGQLEPDLSSGFNS